MKPEFLKQQEPKNFDLARASLLASDSGEVPAWVHDIRQPAFAGFRDQGLPTTRDEEWKYTSLRAVGAVDYDFARHARTVAAADLRGYLLAEAIPLVFVDGIFAPEHSRLQGLPDGLTVMTLGEAFSAKAEQLRKYLRMHDLRAENAFHLLNEAFLSRGLYIEVAPGTQIVPPLNIVFYNSAPEHAQAVFPRLVVVVGAGAELSVSECYAGAAPDRSLTTAVTSLLVEKSAVLGYYRLQLAAAGATHIGQTNAVLAAEARVNSFAYNGGAGLSRHSLDLVFNGVGAHAEVNGLYLGHSDQHLDNYTSINHRVGHTTSSQLYKGVLTDAARAVFSGKIIVRQDAQQSAAVQMNKNLLLSATAEIDTKPQLQIDADDVKCTHGAAVGQLNNDELFYLLSRGIRPAQARAMLCEAFVADVAGLVKAPGIQQMIMDHARRFFHER